MTVFRWWASRRGVVIPAGRRGQAQDHHPEHLRRRRDPVVRLPRRPQAMGWEHNQYAQYWNEFHGGFVAVTLACAALLTVYSFGVYLYRNRRLFSDRCISFSRLRPLPTAARHHGMGAGPMDIELVTIGTELLLGLHARYQRRRDRADAARQWACGWSAASRWPTGRTRFARRARGSAAHRRRAHHRRARAPPAMT